MYHPLNNEKMGSSQALKLVIPNNSHIHIYKKNIPIVISKL